MSYVTPNVYVFTYFKEQSNSARWDDFCFLLREVPLDALLPPPTCIQYQIDLREYQIYERADIIKCVELIKTIESSAAVADKEFKEKVISCIKGSQHSIAKLELSLSVRTKPKENWISSRFCDLLKNVIFDPSEFIVDSASESHMTVTKYSNLFQDSGMIIYKRKVLEG